MAIPNLVDCQKKILDHAMRQAQAVHGKAMPDVGCSAEPNTHNDRAMLRHMATKIEIEGHLDENETAFLRNVADGYDERRKRQAAERDAKARDDADAAREKLANKLRPVLWQILPMGAIEGDARYSLRISRALRVLLEALLP